jgi:dihydropteroate synthase
MGDLRWRHAGGVLDCGRARLVGIVNANPDSFSDNGVSAGTERAIAHAHLLAEAGADVVEVGGESLRFSEHTAVDVEIARVVPVIERLSGELDVPVAVDTFKAPVAAAALEAGASIVNDPTGLRDAAMMDVVATSRAGVVMTHFFGLPKVRPSAFPDGDVVGLIAGWLARQFALAGEAGIAPERIVFDPGLGLGMSPAQDLELLRRIDEIVALGRPVLVPISNKKVLGALTGAVAADRLAETTAGLVWCRARGACLFRVHDVAFMRRALTVVEALAGLEVEAWHEVVK